MNGLLPDDSKLLIEPMWSNHKGGPLDFTTNGQSILYKKIENYTLKFTATSPGDNDLIKNIQRYHPVSIGIPIIYNIYSHTEMYNPNRNTLQKERNDTYNLCNDAIWYAL